MSENIRDRMTGYNPDAIDGDGDGSVQDATPYERPLGTSLTEDQIFQIENEGKSANEILSELVEEAPESATEDVITATVVGKGTEEVNVLAPVGDNAIGSTTRKKSSKKAESKPSTSNEEKPQKVAVFSERNISWTGVGKISKGYNFVDATLAEKWVTLQGVREADHSEIQAAR